MTPESLASTLPTLTTISTVARTHPKTTSTCVAVLLGSAAVLYSLHRSKRTIDTKSTIDTDQDSNMANSVGQTTTQVAHTQLPRTPHPDNNADTNSPPQTQFTNTTSVSTPTQTKTQTYIHAPTNPSEPFTIIHEHKKLEQSAPRLLTEGRPRDWPAAMGPLSRGETEGDKEADLERSRGLLRMMR
ncbi:hypothetical protein FB567DRAFT_619321 [Paraphoma chrysanthemicola]|uniref:Uncharacterized protein n=1 Tax=Paraphoma chrysanthemicola TaxID=798071 RepID=A0A8K0RCG5_9PLEO|nr:hypothetical protein FB567DRAFT_619321 [Paraphoma chrysanthemicola]